MEAPNRVTHGSPPSTMAPSPRPSQGTARETRIVEWRFPCDLSSLEGARGAVAKLGGGLDKNLAEDLQLVVTELVANSLRHGPGGPESLIRLRLSVSDRAVHAEVADDGTGFEPTPETRPPQDEWGMGLYLVQRITHRWGVRSGPGTVVWFEIDRDHFDA
jgi:anti-sigma regulatory factor (Ser/Thr protein kinase)